MSRTDPIAGHLDANYLVLKRRVWMYRRRVPTELAKLDPRGEIRISTGTRERARANMIALEFNEALAGR